MPYYTDTVNMIFSDGQAITASADSTNVIDLGATPTLRALSIASPLYVRVVVTEAFNTLTSLDIGVKSDSTTNMDTSETVHGTRNILLAALTLGAEFVIPIDRVSQTYERYLGIEYTVNGSNPTLGKLTAVLTPSVDSRQYFADGSVIA
jgi:hypothetical protein